MRVYTLPGKEKITRMKTLTFEVNRDEWSVIVGGNGVMALSSSAPCSL